MLSGPGSENGLVMPVGGDCDEGSGGEFPCASLGLGGADFGPLAELP